MTENSTMAKNPTAEATRNGQFVTPRVDILETETELLLFADMPGVTPDDIDLRYEQGELILRGKVQPLERKAHLIFGEFDTADFYRMFQVQESIDASKIEAEFRNGVLTVHLPKQEVAKPKQVPIRVQD
jgi:HSP20 family protein